MSNKYYFTIIIPVFNGEPYIERCLKSIIDQTFVDFEIIIVNDGSTDRTCELCNKLLKQCSHIQIRIIDKNNEGQAVARNHGIDIAEGNYLIFIDSDDFVNSNLLSRLYEKTSGSNYDFVCFGAKFLSSNISLKKQILGFPKHDLTGNDIFIYALTGTYIHSVVWNKVIKREFILTNKINFPNLRYHEDIYFINHMAKMATKVGFIDEIFYYSVVRDFSTSRVINTNTLSCACMLLNLEKKYLINNESRTIQDLFFRHAIKFITYIKIQCAFRSKSFKEYYSSISILNSCEQYQPNGVLKYIKNSDLKTSFIFILSLRTNALWLVAKILKLFKVYPY